MKPEKIEGFLVVFDRYLDPGQSPKLLKLHRGAPLYIARDREHFLRWKHSQETKVC